MGFIESQIGLLSGALVRHPFLVLILSVSLYFVIARLYRISPFHPLAAIPGPFISKISSLYLLYHAYVGDEASAVHALHEKYGIIVRTGPNSLDIADGDALQAIYVEKGGFKKPDFYENFDIDGHKSIFSAIDPSHRSPRAKAVFGIFSTSNLRLGADLIENAISAFVSRFRREIGRARSNHTDTRVPIDVLSICRALAIDVVTGYLFNISYGGCEEDLQQKPLNSVEERTSSSAHDEMTASAMVDSFVAVGKIWYLPPQAFQLFERIQGKLFADHQAATSINAVDEFVAKAVSKTIADKNHTSYPGRLLQAGFDESEVRAQCKDLIFAGTDSTAMNLATICFRLVRDPDTYQKLRTAMLDSNSNDLTSQAEIQSIPYLRGVVKEGLRLSMANPSRLPRIVPKAGWTFKGTHIPAGSIVSCTPFELHLNPQIFPEPHAFKPERWLPENKPTEEMIRDHIPFGLGSRQCIARNLATAELFHAVKRITEEDLLGELVCVRDKIEILEWFNSHVVGGKIEMVIKK